MNQKPINFSTSLILFLFFFQVLSKYDTTSEQEIRNWIKDLVGDEIGTGAYEVEKSLRSGVVLVKYVYQSLTNL